MAVNTQTTPDKDSKTRMNAQGLLGRLRARDIERRSRRSAPGRGDETAADLRGRLGPRGRLALLCAAILLALLGGGWFWLRDSSLVAVEHVTVSGETGPDSAQIRTALVGAAHAMTTLDVSMGRLRAAVAPFPDVLDLKVSTELPHGLRIEVIERQPVGVVVADGEKVDVAGDGTLMYDVPVRAGLPVIPLRAPPGGKWVTDPAGKNEVALLSAAPQRLLAKVSEVTTQAGHGLVAQIRGGPSIYFGAASQLGAKWMSAEAVLADSGSAGAVYIDVTDPRRPAAGGGSAQTAGSSAQTSGAASGQSAATTQSAGAAGTQTAGAASTQTATSVQPTTSVPTQTTSVPTPTTSVPTPTTSVPTPTTSVPTQTTEQTATSG